MATTAQRSAFWSIGISGLIGAAIGAGGTFFAQKQANTAENHFYMELDQFRHAIVLNATTSFEEKRADLERLSKVRRNGFRAVFEDNLEKDISELDTRLANIRKAENAAAAEEARRVEEAKAAAQAQARKEQAVRSNPIIFENCGGRSGVLCP